MSYFILTNYTGDRHDGTSILGLATNLEVARRMARNYMEAHPELAPFYFEVAYVTENFLYDDLHVYWLDPTPTPGVE